MIFGENEEPGWVFENNRFDYNIFINCATGLESYSYDDFILFFKSTLYGDGPTEMNYFCNNVTYGAKRGVYIHGQDVTDRSLYMTIKNNIFSEITQYTYMLYGTNVLGLDINNNLCDLDIFYYSLASHNFTQWKSAYGFDSNSLDIGVNPAFLNASGLFNVDTDFKIPANSPCARAGVNVGLTEDYFGNPIPSFGIDIGAHQISQGRAIKIDLGNHQMILRHSGSRIIEI